MELSTIPFYNDDFYSVMYLEAGAQQAQGNYVDFYLMIRPEQVTKNHYVSL